MENTNRVKIVIVALVSLAFIAAGSITQQELAQLFPNQLFTEYHDVDGSFFLPDPLIIRDVTLHSRDPAYTNPDRPLNDLTWDVTIGTYHGGTPDFNKDKYTVKPKKS